MTMGGATLRVEYLAALGLEPLQLRAPFASANDEAGPDARDALAGMDETGMPGVAGSSGAAAPIADSAAASTMAPAARTAHGSAAASGRAQPPGQQIRPTPATGSRAAGKTAASDAAEDAGLFAPRPARLCFLLPEDDGLDGPNARLLHAIAHAAGVLPAELGIAPDAGIPVIRFAPGSSPGVEPQAPAPAALRSAQAKRALWPTLRRLRRSLRSS